MKKVLELAELRLKAKKGKSVSLPTSTTTKEVSKKRRSEGNTIEQSFNRGARDHLHGLIARMFYTGGLSFNLVRNPYFIEAFKYATSNSLGGYIPPGYNLLRTSLLQKDRAHIEKLLEPIKLTWKAKSVSIVSDGWSDSQRRPLINVMAVTEDGTMFLNAVNAEGRTKNMDYIADILLKAIEEVGPHNVVQVITDNAPICKSAGGIVQGRHPHIFWTPCVVHTLNLALKNICAAKNTERNEVVYEECCWITEVSDDVVVIRNFIMNHSMRLAMFNEYVNLKLLTIAETRFASVVIMLRRFKKIKRGLMDMVISESWSLYRDDNVGRAQFVKGKILDDIWWDKIEYVISFTEPIYNMV
ncbi:uncharacterized protein LOC109828045 [Asparagus officinalis]|uniref:uncharacterized protein LOC109828045 n=1 Tax=Asparagus officinalis TaxID=4686 RepID=UPI00098DFAA3|nr:uncharacterized protein LOC109828045 [Asparagus officinalis]